MVYEEDSVSEMIINDNTFYGHYISLQGGAVFITCYTCVSEYSKIFLLMTQSKKFVALVYRISRKFEDIIIIGLTNEEPLKLYISGEKVEIANKRWSSSS